MQVRCYTFSVYTLHNLSENASYWCKDRIFIIGNRKLDKTGVFVRFCCVYTDGHPSTTNSNSHLFI